MHASLDTRRPHASRSTTGSGVRAAPWSTTSSEAWNQPSSVIPLDFRLYSVS
jgi:hypothetical protein